MAELKNTDKPFFRSGIISSGILSSAIIPLFIFKFTMGIVHNNYPRPNPLFDKLAIGFVFFYVVYMFIILVFLAKRFYLYEDRVEIYYPLRFKPFFQIKKIVIMNQEIEEVSFGGVAGGGRYSGNNKVRFEIKGTGQKPVYYYFNSSWVMKMKLIYNKYVELNVPVYITSEALKKTMGIK